MIQITDLHARFDGKSILRGVNLHVERGEILALVGPSGTGKSVLLKHIIGLLVAQRGTITVGDMSVGAADFDALSDLRRRMGYVFQDAALLDWLTVKENLLLALDPREVLRDSRRARARAAEALRMVKLPEAVENLKPAQLSGGMRKRVGVARAAMGRVDVMLYDEPTTGLDPKNVSAINEAILRVRAECGATSIVVTHDMSSVAAIADRVALLMGGRIQFHGTASAFFDADTPPVSDFTERKITFRRT